MLKALGPAAALLVALAFLLLVSPVSAQSSQPSFADLIIRFKPGLSPDQISQALAARGLIEVQYDPDLNIRRARAANGGDLIPALLSLESDSSVTLAEPNYRVHAVTGRGTGLAPSLLPAANKPNDPLFGQQWGLRRIRAPLAWTYLQGATGTVTIAVIDTGIDRTHPDLRSRVAKGYNFVNPGTPPDDDYWHGTHVAGIAGAIQRNGIGIAGTAVQVRLLPLKVLDAEGGGTIADLASAIRFAARRNVRVMNMSLATSPWDGNGNCPRVLQEQIDFAFGRGALAIAAAGNDYGGKPVFPAACGHVVAVASSDYADQLSYFSNYGKWVDLMAPGEDIISTIPGGEYSSENGTSMATPFVAGAAALVWLRHPGLSPGQVEALIEHSADHSTGPIPNDRTGWGRLDAAQAVAGSR